MRTPAAEDIDRTRLYQYARRLCDSREDAEDLVQDTIVRALQYGDADRSIGALRAWMMTTMRNLRIDALRQRRPVRSLDAMPIGCAEALAVTPPPDAERIGQAEDLARAEAARDAKKRQAVREEVFEMANKQPENVAQIIKKWLSEE